MNIDVDQPVTEEPELMAILGRQPHELFDAEWYLETYTDVAEADQDPWQHFVSFGFAERRQPNAWFDTAWYAAHYESVLEEGINPFDHFCQIGAEVGYSWSESAELALHEEAAARFDADFYGNIYPDIVEAGADPWHHFISHGCYEGRWASAGFDSSYYAERYLADLPVPVNPLFHFVRHGERLNIIETRGLNASPLPEAAPAVLLDETVQSISTSKNLSQIADAEELLQNSFLFDTTYLAEQDDRYAGLPKASAINLFLATANSELPNPSPWFSSEFYTNSYLKGQTGAENALVHFLRTGRFSGFFPTPSIAFENVHFLKSQFPDFRSFYTARINHVPRHSDPALDYLLLGRFRGIDLNLPVDDDFIYQVYGGFDSTALSIPLRYYQQQFHCCWLFSSADDLKVEADRIRESALFDDGFYKELVGLEDDNIDGATHYVLSGSRAGLAASAEYDTGFYLAFYPDIAKGRITPILHYQENGIREGRSALMDGGIIDDIPGEQEFDPEKPSLLLFSHEASRTGAPIVILNIARHLSETYNVFCWIGKRGDLVGDFIECSVSTFIGFGATDQAADVMERLKLEFGVKLAIVNSVVCWPVMPSLRIAELPVISLIHEFADYVYPAGTTSRMVNASDITVYPAGIVRDATFREEQEFGISRPNSDIRIHPQGWNESGANKDEGLTPEDLYARLGILPDDMETRILFGAGQVQPRKGVDLFLQTASILKRDSKHKWKFIWVGGGYDPKADMVTSVYLAHQIRASGLDQDFFFFSAQPNLDAFWSVADVFYMSSRLDPFPNVALDSLNYKVPVICFEGGTGVADIADEFPFAVRKVAFADAFAAANEADAIIDEYNVIARAFAGTEGERLTTSLSFEHYVDCLNQLIPEAIEHFGRYPEVYQRLISMDHYELRMFARLLAEPLRLFNFDRPSIHAHSLTKMLTGELSDFFLALAPGETEPVGATLPDFIERWDPNLANAAGDRSAHDISVLLFVGNHDVTQKLQSLPQEQQDLIKSLNVTLVFPDSQVKRDFEASPIADQLNFAEQTFAESVEALVSLNETTEAEYAAFVYPYFEQTGSKICLANSTLSFMYSLADGASRNHLDRSPDSDAVLPDRILRSAPETELSLLGDRKVAFPSAFSKGFTGLYRLESVRRFQLEHEHELRSLPGSEVETRLVVTSLIYSDFVAAKHGKIILTPPQIFGR